MKNSWKYVKDRVSAVIPVYNGEIFLASLLESMINQTYPYMEIILVDDGSTDGTLKLAEKYRPRFAEKGYSYYVVQAEHQNASAAINHGLPYVTGEYLIWPDSDDRLEKYSVEKRVKFLQSHLQYQCVRSLSYYFDYKTGELTEADEAIGDISNKELFWDILESRTYVCCGCYMLRSEAFFEIYPERHIPEYDVGQNFQMLLPFMFRHQCPTIPEQLYGVCVRTGSHSRRELTQEEEEKKYNDYEKLIDEIACICNIRDKKAKDRIAYWKARRRYQLFLKYGCKKNMMWVLCCMSHYEKRGFLWVLKDYFWECYKETWWMKKYTVCSKIIRNGCKQ